MSVNLLLEDEFKPWADIRVNNLKVDGNVDGNLDLTGDLEVSGTSDLKGNLNVDLNTDLTGNLDVSGTSNLHGNLNVDLNTDLTGNLDVSGTSNLHGNLNVDLNTDLTGDLDVSGTITYQGQVMPVPPYNDDVSQIQNNTADIFVKTENAETTAIYSQSEFRKNYDVNGNLRSVDFEGTVGPSDQPETTIFFTGDVFTNDAQSAFYEFSVVVRKVGSSAMKTFKGNCSVGYASGSVQHGPNYNISNEYTSAGAPSNTFSVINNNATNLFMVFGNPSFENVIWSWSGKKTLV